MPPKQFKLNQNDFKKVQAFGGSLLKKAKNRTSRPISTKHAMHLVLRANYKPRLGGFLEKRNRQITERTLARLAQKYGVKIYQMALNSNHIHLLVKLSNRRAYAAFIRSLTGTIALKISKASKLKALNKKFWEYRPFTRIVDGFKAFSIAKDYVLLNQLEAFGAMPYQLQRLKYVSRDRLYGLAEQFLI